MRTYRFVGWPLADAQREALRTGVTIQSVEMTTSSKIPEDASGAPYIIQERWIGDQAVAWVTGMRFMGKGIETYD